MAYGYYGKMRPSCYTPRWQSADHMVTVKPSLSGEKRLHMHSRELNSSLISHILNVIIDPPAVSPAGVRGCLLSICNVSECICAASNWAVFSASLLYAGLQFSTQCGT